jgi:hippurate hydrolase
MNAHVYPELQKRQGEHAKWRQDIHRHPELGYEEHRTAKIVAEKLESFGVEVFTGYGTTGVVGKLSNGLGNRAIGLRADLDALPMQEKNEFGHKSVNDGVFHGCGHDGHTVMLLGAAEFLAKSKSFDGTIYFIFQPAEEGLAGGAAMVKDGLFEDFDMESVYGLHNSPDMPVGNFAVCEGPMMAAADTFDITITGKGGHAAMPHYSTDPVIAITALVQALQTIVSRTVNPQEPAVLSVTTIHAGDAYNVIPDDAKISGGVRTFNPKVAADIEQRMREITEQVASAHGCTAKFTYAKNYPVVFNTSDETKLCADVARSLAGEDNVKDDITPVMGSEDFSFMLQERPGCYILMGAAGGLGNGGGGGCMVHNPGYDFNDEALPLGATYWSKLAETLLPAPR